MYKIIITKAKAILPSIMTTLITKVAYTIKHKLTFDLENIQNNIQFAGTLLFLFSIHKMTNNGCTLNITEIIYT